MPITESNYCNIRHALCCSQTIQKNIIYVSANVKNNPRLQELFRIVKLNQSAANKDRQTFYYFFFRCFIAYPFAGGGASLRTRFKTYSTYIIFMYCIYIRIRIILLLGCLIIIALGQIRKTFAQIENTARIYYLKPCRVTEEYYCKLLLGKMFVFQIEFWT